MPNINKNIIKQAGAAVANATNKAAGLSASTPEPGSIISAIQLVNGGRTIGPASLLHFTESVRNKLLSLLVSMEPIQDLNGYDHPWPAGGGVNLFDKNAITIGKYLNLNTGAIENTSTSYAITDWIGVDGGSAYAWNNPESSRAWFYDSDKNPVERINGTSYIPDSDGFIILTITVIRVDVNDFMFVKGSALPQIYYPYSNICPISGRTGLDVYAGPTSAIGDAATYSMDWTSPAGTVYAGSADIVSGDIKAAPYYASYNGETLVGPWISSMDEYDPERTPTTGAQVVDLGGTMTEYHITGQDIITLVGDNYIWSDSGDVTITE